MARLPDGLRLYAVGDIHGSSDLLRRLIGSIEADSDARGPAEVRLMFLGDYIDRGPDSPGVLDLLMEPRAWARTTCLRGNHEDALLSFLKDPVEARFWIDWGGLATMRAYGVPFSSDLYTMSHQLNRVLPDRHRAFFKAMPVKEIVGDYLFVHAGVDPALPLDRQDPFTLTTIREPFLTWGKPLEKIVVHGHTISSEPELLSWRIGIDTGAYHSGRLTALGLENDRRWILHT